MKNNKIYQRISVTVDIANQSHTNTAYEGISAVAYSSSMHLSKTGYRKMNDSPRE